MPRTSTVRMVGANLKRYRKIAGLSQHELAEIAGLSRSSIAAIEVAVYPSVSLKTVQLLAQVLKISAAEFLTPDPAMTLALEPWLEDFKKSYWAKALNVLPREIEWLRSIPKHVIMPYGETRIKNINMALGDLIRWKRNFILPLF